MCAIMRGRQQRKRAEKQSTREFVSRFINLKLADRDLRRERIERRTGKHHVMHACNVNQAYVVYRSSRGVRIEKSKFNPYYKYVSTLSVPFPLLTHSEYKNVLQDSGILLANANGYRTSSSVSSSRLLATNRELVSRQLV